jgi:hypothetical protein
MKKDKACLVKIPKEVYAIMMSEGKSPQTLIDNFIRTNYGVEVTSKKSRRIPLTLEEIAFNAQELSRIKREEATGITDRELEEIL